MRERELHDFWGAIRHILTLLPHSSRKWAQLNSKGRGEGYRRDSVKLVVPTMNIQL
jgi:hypothetical protein